MRIHEDEEDRLQRNSTYNLVDRRLVLEDLGLLGNAGNRVQTAQALSLFAQHELVFDAWSLTYGVRYEDIDQVRVRYRDADNNDFATRSVVRDSRSNVYGYMATRRGFALSA